MNTWHEALAAFDDHLRELGRQASTRRTARERLGAFGRAVARGPWQVEPSDVESYIDSKRTTAYQHGVLTDLRSFYGWAVRAGMTATSPVPSRADRRSPAAEPPRCPDAWWDQIEAWERSCRAANRSRTTIRLQRHYLHNLATTYPDPWAVTLDQLVDWLLLADWAPETRRSARGAARSFYRWATRHGRTDRNPAEDLEPVTIPRALPRPASDTVLRDALDRANDRARLMLCLAALAGLRSMEVAAVHTRDLVDGVLVVHGKGGVGRRIPIHPRLQAEVDAELDRRRRGAYGTGYRYVDLLTTDGYLFPGQFGRHVTAGDVSRCLSKLMGPDWTAHTLRHRFASSAYAVDRDLRAVQELLGHAKPETTARYCAVPGGALRSAVYGVGL